MRRSLAVTGAVQLNETLADEANEHGGPRFATAAHAAEVLGPLFKAGCPPIPVVTAIPRLDPAGESRDLQVTAYQCFGVDINSPPTNEAGAALRDLLAETRSVRTAVAVVAVSGAGETAAAYEVALRRSAVFIEASDHARTGAKESKTKSGDYARLVKVLKESSQRDSSFAEQAEWLYCVLLISRCLQRKALEKRSGTASPSAWLWYQLRGCSSDELVATFANCMRVANGHSPSVLRHLLDELEPGLVFIDEAQFALPHKMNRVDGFVASTPAAQCPAPDTRAEDFGNSDGTGTTGGTGSAAPGVRRCSGEARWAIVRHDPRDWICPDRLFWHEVFAVPC